MTRQHYQDRPDFLQELEELDDGFQDVGALFGDTHPKWARLRSADGSLRDYDGRDV